MGKPIIKWAGGKTQLLSIIDAQIPDQLKQGSLTTYIEPFFGGGAVFFNLVEKYRFKRSILIDVNPELIALYTVIKEDVEKLIGLLETLRQRYLPEEVSERKAGFYEIRDLFNENVKNFDYSKTSKERIERAAHFIFLNKTCFNGLFRVNKKAEFNVPFGNHKTPPTILNKDRLREASALLQTATLICGSYTQCEPFVDDKSFVYMDPPYRPLSSSASFTAYSKYDFRDEDQIALGRFFEKLSKTGASLMLSNSDPKNVNVGDCFFDNLYAEFNINRVQATRMINSDSSKRGKITEILVTNYAPSSKLILV